MPDLTSTVTTLACSTEKGGVGKTTTTLNLGAQLALWGARVCIVDFDPQGQSGTGLGLDPIPRERTVCAALTLSNLNVPFEPSVFLHDRSEMVRSADGEGSLTVIGTNKESMDELTDWVQGSRRDKAKAIEAVTALRRFIQTHLSGFDYVLIDTPPTTNQLNALALAASDYVIGVAASKYASFSGIVALRGQTEKVPESTDGTCRPFFLGTLLNETPSKQTAQDRNMRAMFGASDAAEDGNAVGGEYEEESVAGLPHQQTAELDHFALFEASIHSSELISAAYAEGTPAVLLHPNRRLAEEYGGFAKEVFERIAEHRALTGVSAS